MPITLVKKNQVTTTKSISEPEEVKLEEPAAPALPAEVVSLPESQAAQQVAPAPPSPKDMVLITMHETIEPAPVIGAYNTGRELKVKSLLAKATYRLPRFVAEIIVDAKKGCFVNVTA